MMIQGQPFDSTDYPASMANKSQQIDKPSLESLPTEIQLDIIRHLLFDDDTVVFGPCQQDQASKYKRSLGILTASKHFFILGSNVLYRENSFLVSESCMSYHRRSV